MKLTGKKLILLLLYAPTETSKPNVPIAGRTRLMKMVFLFKEEVWPDFNKDRNFDGIDLPEFFAWKYGPFSSGLLNDLEFLVNQNYVSVRTGNIASEATEAAMAEYEFWVEDTSEPSEQEYEEEVFEINEDRGISKASDFWTALTDNQKKYLTEFKTVFTRASLSRILEYVYKKYQKAGYTDKSVIRERFLS
jgi:uncharacterized protein